MSDLHPSIDPGVVAYVEKARRDAGRMAGIVDLSPDQRRLRAEILARVTAERHPDWLSTHTTYVTLPGREIPVRVYVPAGDGPRPAILYLHGGSWIAGSPESHDFITASLAANTGAVVLSVHYRRAPENPYPAATEDAYAALCWAAERAEALGIDPDRIAIAGDSAGGNLAAACALMARDRGGPAIRHQTLLYPTLDDDLETESYRASTDPILTRAAMREALEAFLPEGAGPQDGYALPMRAPSLAGLPPAYLSIAALDPLRDDGLRYAARLERAGVPTVTRVGPGLIHGYVRMRRFSAVAETEFQAVCAEIRVALNLPSGPVW
ncbi:alpha/beta hydrolase [Roseomonas sp. KE2513]|uniref:alpha/beta hydrolase n=1 Tax=Roseomonas sp. KE2513 TaxID=2479202 RepID=UPI0018DF9715|nr:alpha/beta hydrolase [Roseomonas sp. KE2513]